MNFELQVDILECYLRFPGYGLVDFVVTTESSVKAQIIYLTTNNSQEETRQAEIMLRKILNPPKSYDKIRHKNLIATLLDGKNPRLDNAKKLFITLIQEKNPEMKNLPTEWLTELLPEMI